VPGFEQTCVCVSSFNSTGSNTCELDSECPAGSACVPFRAAEDCRNFGVCLPLCTA
jgi:hypothetical protein